MRGALRIMRREFDAVWRRDTILVLFKYALAGGLATTVNFLVRIPLTPILGFELAVVVAQAIGFTTGFLLYRTFVFTGAETRLVQQVAAFGGVNLLAAAVVITVAIALRQALLAVGLADFNAEMIAHAGGLAAGAPFNFGGHFLVTFRKRRLA